MVTAVSPTASIESGERRLELHSDASGLVAVLGEAERDDLRVRLGITVGDRRLDVGSRVLRFTTTTVVERLRLVSGKTTLPKERTHRETTVVLEHGDIEWVVRMRLADDGFAVRYEIPDLWGVSTLDADHTALELDGVERAWMLDYQTWYETPRAGHDLADLPAGDHGFPALLRTAGERYVLVTESGIDGRFSGSHAVVDDARSVLAFRAADERTEIARGEVTPWRVFVVGALATVVESTLVDELAPPPHRLVEDVSWVRPGRAAWSWWSDFYSGAQLETQMHFVDEAARMGWEHLLIDCGWEETWVPEIVAYASRFGIQVHLWCVWHELDGPAGLEKLGLWASWGIAGVKVDFMESESKDRYRWYDAILRETARLRLMVNFHGSVIPRGWARTWPHVVTYEAIRGSEYYVFYQDTPLTPKHNVIQPFTRNVVGAMDYTPVALTAPGRTTSEAHELAMGVAFESGITHFADSVDTYLARPIVAGVLAELPDRWDETLLLAGSPDTEAVIARRRDDRWFVGVLATGEARTVTVSLGRIGDGPFSAWTVTDAPTGDGLVEDTVTVTDRLELALARNGGAVAVLAPVGSPVRRAAPTTPVPEPRVEAAVVETDEHGRVDIVLPEGASLRVPPRWSVDRTAGGRWTVSHPADVLPGRGGVVTLECEGRDGVALFAPIRVLRPLSGSVGLSDLPMLAFRNESGPVERDMSNGGGNPRDGRRMSVAGVEHDRGIGMSAPAWARFHAGGRASRLTGEVGVDDETPDTRAVVVVEADGREVLRRPVAAGLPPLAFDVDVSGAHSITLRTEPVGDAPAHVDWLSPHLHTPRS